VTLGEPLAAAMPAEALPLERSPMLQLFAGGAEVNFAVGMRRLGFDTCLIGKVGDDPPGRLIQRALAAEGIDISHVGVGPEQTALYLREWLPDGQRRVYYYRAGSAGARFTAADWPTDLADVAWLHLTGITPALSESCRQAALAALNWALERKIPVSFDPNYRPRLWDIDTARRDLRPFMTACSVLLIGLEEADLLLGCTSVTDAAAAAAALGPDVVVVKKGAAGASAWRDGRVWHQPAFATDAADPVGAGDAFDAGCVAALLHGGSLGEALALGAYCGARVAAVPGEHAGFPGRESIPPPLRRPI
jgi:2-dehydro-3-deoxygluconokinase